MFVLKFVFIATVNLIFAVFIQKVILTHASESLLVNIDDGPVQGYLRKSYDGKTYIAFEGIPYAKPPINEFRFKSPEIPIPWKNVLNANKTFICAQLLPFALGTELLGQEDCLYVNVYVPGDSIQTKVLKHVIVHIHGGAFMLGAPRIMAGAKYIMNEDLIYVSFNYRVGFFGFAHADEGSGNWGLKDQNFALQWIQRNIDKFGGNAKSITLTGQSAGAASVHYHILSKRSKGLFHKAVLISGTALNPWAFTKNNAANTKQIAHTLNCDMAIANETMDCLRKLSTKELILSVKSLFKFANVLPIAPFAPVSENNDDAFITQSPDEILKRNDVINDVPMIFSFVKDEGIFPSGYFAMIGQIGNIKNNWNEIMPYGLNIHELLPKDKWIPMVQKVKEYYYPEDNLSLMNLNNLTKLFSDRIYLTKQEESIRRHLKINNQPIYLYYFNYDSPAFKVFPMVKGVAHCEDSQLIFSLITSPPELTKEDNEMSHLLTKIMANFASTSEPLHQWKPLKSDSERLDYFYITKPDGNGMDSINELAPTKFWNTWSI